MSQRATVELRVLDAGLLYSTSLNRWVACYEYALLIDELHVTCIPDISRTDLRTCAAEASVKFSNPVDVVSDRVVRKRTLLLLLFLSTA